MVSVKGPAGAAPVPEKKRKAEDAGAKGKSGKKDGGKKHKSGKK